MSGAGVWQEARHTDGRVYYWNTQTKETRWTKPEPAPSEQSSGSQPWREYTAPDGRKYYHNTETKATVWEMPEAYRLALAQGTAGTPTPQATPTTQNFVAGGGGTSNFQQQYHHQQQQQQQQHHQPQHRDREDHHQARFGDRQRDHGQSENLRNNFVPAAAGGASTSNEPEFASFEEAEAAFMKLLKRHNVEPEWSWEEAMKTIIKDPQYRAIKDPKDRKAAFEKYVTESRAQDKERAKERMAKLRQDFTTMLKSHPEIKHYTRWKTARPIIEGETIFRSTGDDAERRQLFEEYVQSLRKAHIETEADTRRAALDELSSVLHAIDLEPYTRWSDAQRSIEASERFQSDDKFQALTKSDVLTAFENHIKSLERSFNDTRQLQKKQKARRERQNRDAFVALLRELRDADKIKAGTKWMDVLPLVGDDPRYVAMLGQAGSTPLDLFWDVVEEEERVLRSKRNEVLDVLDAKRYEVTPNTSLEEFVEVLQSDRRTSSMKHDDLKLIFTRLHEKILRRSEEDKHHAERAQRRAVDALRSRIKHLDPPVRASDSWEDDVRPRIERFEEYKALESDELRRSALDKVVKRMKEKEADAEHLERARRNERAERERERASGNRRARGGAQSRTPEADAYEADRRKAMADRERQYRKSSTTGLSPPPTDAAHARRRDARDRYDDRHDRRSSRGHERERRERDTERERERGFVSRADPRESAAKELDYGESAGSMSGSASRRRRESDDEDGDSAGEKRESKRPKREREQEQAQAQPQTQQSKTPVDSAAAAAAKEEGEADEEAALKSGSEEGELAED